MSVTTTTSGTLRARSFDPLIILWVVLAAALIFLVVNPLYQLVHTSLEEADTGNFTLLNYLAAHSKPRYLTAMWNSVRLGFCVTALCLVIVGLASALLGRDFMLHRERQ